MVSKLDVIVPDSWHRRSREWGEALKQHYDGGGSPNSLAVSSHGAEGNIALQQSAKLAECAFCVWGNLDPGQALKWDLVPDGGFDAVWQGIKPDVKSTQHRNARYLFWPVKKTHLFDSKRFDVLVLVEASIEDPRCTLRGWVKKSAFRRDRLVATEGDGTKLTPDTRYMLAENLWSMELLEDAARLWGRAS